MNKAKSLSLILSTIIATNSCAPCFAFNIFHKKPQKKESLFSFEKIKEKSGEIFSKSGEIFTNNKKAAGFGALGLGVLLLGTYGTILLQKPYKNRRRRGMLNRATRHPDFANNFQRHGERIQPINLSEDPVIRARQMQEKSDLLERIRRESYERYDRENPPSRGTRFSALLPFLLLLYPAYKLLKIAYNQIKK